MAGTLAIAISVNSKGPPPTSVYCNYQTSLFVLEHCAPVSSTVPAHRRSQYCLPQVLKERGCISYCLCGQPLSHSLIHQISTESLQCVKYRGGRVGKARGQLS